MAPAHLALEPLLLLLRVRSRPRRALARDPLLLLLAPRRDRRPARRPPRLTRPIFRAPKFTRDLEWSTGKDVQDLQKALGTYRQDGIFGQETVAAVKLWQRANDVEATGYFGPAPAPSGPRPTAAFDPRGTEPHPPSSSRHPPPPRSSPSSPPLST